MCCNAIFLVYKKNRITKGGVLIIINVYDNGTGNKVGTYRMDKESYNWNHDIVHSFGFIPYNPKYVYGIFLLENADELEISKEEFIYNVSKFKLLLRNTNPNSQFDDTENSKWVEF